MTHLLRTVNAHTVDVKNAYEQGFRDAMKSVSYHHPDQLLEQCYAKWIKDSK